MIRLQRKNAKIFLRRNFWQAVQNINQPAEGGSIRQRFAIIASPRTGSNYLYEALNSLPSVRMYHEIFAPHYRKATTTFKTRSSVLYNRQPTFVDSLGVKIFYSHLSTNEWVELLERRDFRYLHLTRKNRLKTVISLTIAKTTDQWTNTNRQTNSIKPKVRLNENHLIGQLNELASRERRFRQQFSETEILELSYEELTKNPAETLSRASNFLSLDAIDHDNIPLKKQNSEAISDLIENYEEVARLLRGTEYENFLAQDA